MFGHTDNQQLNNQAAQGQPLNDPAIATDQIMHNGSLEEQQTVANPQPSYDPGLDQIPSATPTADPIANNPFGLPTAPAPEPATQNDFSAPSAPTPTASGSNEVVSEELLDLKQKALQELSPLVSHLEQSPEEKFKTTMMMIQASDDQALLPAAYEAAQAITDEKAKAQALLDVVNEINYFTQSS